MPSPASPDRRLTRQRINAAASYFLLSIPLLFGRPTRKRSLAERLAVIPSRGMPLQDPVIIRWNDSQVPWISAQSDRDCAVALGLVHAHLRIGQMEMLRRIAQGRTSEMFGPAAISADRILRTIGLTSAVPAILATLPPETLAWIEGFVAGVNHYLERVEDCPSDFALLGLNREAWTAADVIALSRAAAADVNWLIWFRLWRLRGDRRWPDLWQRFIQYGTGTIANFAGELPEALLRASLNTGSNAWAVHARASKTGGALLACDPHLPITMPNEWVAVAYSCPSYRVAGLMLPGLPFMAVGRNPWIAWGGTAAHAATSDLFDLCSFPAERFTIRRETIKVRAARPVQIDVRTSRFGPVISDAIPMGGSYALRWVGHAPSDEITAMLRINRAHNIDEFVAAADLMAIPGENFIVAEVSGSIAKHLAVSVPHRSPVAFTDIVTAPDRLDCWDRMATGRDFPIERDPVCGFVVSANDRPAEGGLPIGLLFSPPDRAIRIATALASNMPISPRLMSRLQGDVELPSARSMRDRLVEIAGAQPASGHDIVLKLLRQWDGAYAVPSRGALAFELLIAHFAACYHEEVTRAFHASVWTARTLMLREFDGEPSRELLAALSEAIARTGKDLSRFKTWGDIHRLILEHPLGRLPVVGRRLRFADLPVGGTSDTVMKTAHAAVARRHRVVYGSVARFLADLSSPDETYAVILGGQDGWLGSDTSIDQLELWCRGDAIRLPLQAETAAAEFRRIVTLEPVHRG